MINPAPFRVSLLREIDLIKLHASYSKKIPAETQYSSKSFHASLEVEVADDLARDGDQLQQKLRSLWQDLQDAVETQITQSNGNGNSAPIPRREEMTKPENGDDRASSRQINYLTLLARRSKGWGLSALEKFIQDRFGNGSLFEISMSNASTLIEEFKSMTPGQGARR